MGVASQLGFPAPAGRARICCRPADHHQDRAADNPRLRDGPAGRLGLSELLTYPEFLITTASRQMSGQPLPGTYAYGRILGTLALPGTRLGGWLASRRKAVRFPWKTTLLVIAILTSCWYLAPKIPASGAQTVLANVNTDDVHVNTWLTTGRWVPAAPARTCIAAAALTHRRPHRKRRHHHPK